MLGMVQGEAGMSATLFRTVLGVCAALGIGLSAAAIEMYCRQLCSACKPTRELRHPLYAYKRAGLG